MKSHFSYSVIIIRKIFRRITIKNLTKIILEMNCIKLLCFRAINKLKI